MPPTPGDPPATDAPSAERKSFLRALLPFASLLALAIVVAGYVALLRPRFAELRDLQRRAGIARDTAELERQIAALADARRTFASEFTAAREVMDAAVPSGEDVPGLFVAIDAAAQQTRVIVTSMEVTREPAPTSLPALRGNAVLLLGVALRSVDYPRLKAFLGVLAASRRLMDVLSAQFSPETLTATLRLRAYTIE